MLPLSLVAIAKLIDFSSKPVSDDLALVNSSILFQSYDTFVLVQLTTLGATGETWAHRIVANCLTSVIISNSRGILNSSIVC